MKENIIASLVTKDEKYVIYCYQSNPYYIRYSLYKNVGTGKNRTQVELQETTDIPWNHQEFIGLYSSDKVFIVRSVIFDNKVHGIQVFEGDKTY